jgi:hypothetical protein
MRSVGSSKKMTGIFQARRRPNRRKLWRPAVRYSKYTKLQKGSNFPSNNPQIINTRVTVGSTSRFTMPRMASLVGRCWRRRDDDETKDSTVPAMQASASIQGRASRDGDVCTRTACRLSPGPLSRKNSKIYSDRTRGRSSKKPRDCRLSARVRSPTPATASLFH